MRLSERKKKKKLRKFNPEGAKKRRKGDRPSRDHLREGHQDCRRVGKPLRTKNNMGGT